MVDRFHTKALELPDAEQDFRRADLHFYDVEHAGPTFEARIFLGAKRGIDSSAGAEDPAYAGSFFVFGHGDCYGEVGHCDVPTERDAYDLRLPHHLEPSLQIVSVTEAVERLVAAGRESAALDVFVRDARGEPLKALSFSTARLLTYA
jgi:hypothetical protein